jgi:hypothetical protein
MSFSSFGFPRPGLLRCWVETLCCKFSISGAAVVFRLSLVAVEVLLLVLDAIVVGLDSSWCMKYC